MGLCQISIFAQKIEFSPLSAFYPQFFTSYPQVEPLKSAAPENLGLDKTMELDYYLIR